MKIEIKGFLLLNLILLFSLAAGGSAVAQSYTDPHGSASGNSYFCSVCHTMHESPTTNLLKETPESALCFTCHNGTGSIYDIQVEMNLEPGANAMHPINVNLNYNSGVYTYTPATTAGIAPPGPYECSACHNPHRDYGFGTLLRGDYDTSEYVTYPGNPDPYSACWSCHSTGVVDDNTSFKHHEHIREGRSPCTACHYSPHGVANRELIRFNPAFVGPSSSLGNGPSFVDNGDHSGSCPLSCHGVDHDPFSY